MKVRKPTLTVRQLITLAVLLSGTLVIMGLSWYTTKRVPHNNWLFTGHYACSFCDINSRIEDVMTVKHGGVLYSFYDHHQYFTYPTAALFLFWPLSWVSHFWAVTGWSFITIASYAGLVMLGWRQVRGALTWRSAGVILWATALGVTIFPTMAICLSQGQTASFLALVVAMDYLAIRGRAQGVLTGIAAAIKIYPIIFIGVWIARRQWRQALTALASGAMTTALAWLIWPKHSSTFFFHRLTSGREISHFHSNVHWRSSSSSPYSFFYRPPFDGGSWHLGRGPTVESRVSPHVLRGRLDWQHPECTSGLGSLLRLGLVAATRRLRGWLAPTHGLDGPHRARSVTGAVGDYPR